MLAQKLGFEYYEVSSKSSESVHNAVAGMAIKIKTIIDQKRKSSALNRQGGDIPEMYPPDERTSVVDLTSPTKSEEQTADCCRTS